MSNKQNKQDGSEQRVEQHRDAVLLRLLKTPPQLRPKRDRGNDKSTQNCASRASGKKP